MWVFIVFFFNVWVSVCVCACGLWVSHFLYILFNNSPLSNHNIWFNSRYFCFLFFSSDRSNQHVHTHTLIFIIWSVIRIRICKRSVRCSIEFAHSFFSFFSNFQIRMIHSYDIHTQNLHLVSFSFTFFG